MKMTIEIEMNNSVFEENGVDEVANIIAEGLSKVDTVSEIAYISLRDTNGNRVGILKITE